MSPISLPPVDANQRYNIPEALAYLRTSRAKLYQLINTGIVRTIKDGARTYVPGSEIIKQSTLPVCKADTQVPHHA